MRLVVVAWGTWLGAGASGCFSAPRAVLQGCVVLFSRCWPQNVSAPQSHPLWVLATGMGAECQEAYDARVTHVVRAEQAGVHVARRVSGRRLAAVSVCVPTRAQVAAAAGTAKAMQAEQEGKHVVAPQWLHACAFRCGGLGARVGSAAPCAVGARPLAIR